MANLRLGHRVERGSPAHAIGSLLLAVAAAGCTSAATSIDRPSDAGRDANEGGRLDASLDAGDSGDGPADGWGGEDAAPDAVSDDSGAADAHDAADAADASDAASTVDAPDAPLNPLRPEIVCATDPSTAPEPSAFIVDASVEMAAAFDLPSDGDLWPSCWSGDALYAGWGDGFGFSDAGEYARPSIGVARVLGDPSEPDAMSGASLVHDTGPAQTIFKVWTAGSYYQKPTGMLCLGGNLYLAVQDLSSSNYDDAPAATIALSTDSGETWSEDTIAPMFSGHAFTTIMFLDYGQDSAAIGEYVYVYGLDYNWRFSSTVTPPQGLYLARIPVGSDLQDRLQWEFFAGSDPVGNPTWTADLASRLPVLVDCTRRYASGTFPGYTVISQGSIVYDAPLQRYLYTSWTEYTYEFYEAPEPWGPWRKFLFVDFGLYPWTAGNNGGYATTVPSKYMSEDGGAMWLQSNTWSSGVNNNNFSLRTLNLFP